MTVFEVDDARFEAEVLKAELPVLVDLYADWCAPCKQLSPIVDEVAKELAGKLKVVKVDIEKSPMIAQAMRVQSIPMLVLFSKGQLAGHHLGVLDKAGILKLVEPVLPREAETEVKPEELSELLKQGRCIPIDIRDQNSYGRYRIPQAKHVDDSQLLEHAAELAPTDGLIRVLYGRSGVEGKAAADKLREAGVPVAYLAGGFLHWEADGFEVERG